MIFITALILVCVDVITKQAVLNTMQCGRSIEVLPGVFRLTLVMNEAAAFGLLKGQRAFFIVAAVTVISAVSFYAIKNRRPPLSLTLGLGLILGGAFGNLIDRIFIGRVVDFLDFRIWPVFNVADSAITIGTVIIISRMLFHQSHKL